jgi:hypothetical protein
MFQVFLFPQKEKRFHFIKRNFDKELFLSVLQPNDNTVGSLMPIQIPDTTFNVCQFSPKNFNTRYYLLIEAQ